jgi:hypothetical protein
MDAWNLSEDELTKEYCILSSDIDSKLPPRRPQNAAKVHHNKNQLPVVHKASTSSSFPTSSNYLTTANSSNNETNATRSLNLDSISENVSPSAGQSTSNAVVEKSSNAGVEYG